MKYCSVNLPFINLPSSISENDERHNLMRNTDENDIKKTSKAWQLKKIYNACNKAKNKMMTQKINIDVHFYCK